MPSDPSPTNPSTSAAAQAALAYLMDCAPVLALRLDPERRITQASAFARTLLGNNILTRPLLDLAVPFTPFPELSGPKSPPTHECLVTLETADGSPRSFHFRFEPIGNELLALGRIDHAEQLRLEREILGINRELADVTRQLHLSNAELEQRNVELRDALANVKALTRLLPICATCKKIRDDDGYWNEVEKYLHTHAEVKFTHGLCPQCTDQFLSSLDP